MKSKVSNSPGRKLKSVGKEKMAEMSKFKKPSVKKIDNRYPQTRKGGKV